MLLLLPMLTQELDVQGLTSAARDIEMIAELAIANLTHSRMLWAFYQFSEVHPDYERDEISPAMYIESAVEATNGRCALMSTWTGNFLRTAYPGRFTNMFLFRSKVPNDTPQGVAEGAEWGFDTWLMLQDNDGRYYALSPALHDNPEGTNMVSVFESDTLEGIVAHVTSQRPGWDWPTAEEVREFMTSQPTEPDSFYSFDSMRERPHSTTCITLVKRGDKLIADPARLQFSKLDVYA